MCEGEREKEEEEKCAASFTSRGKVMERKRDFNELIKYIVLSYSAFQLKMQPDREKKNTQPIFFTPSSSSFL